MLYLGPCLGPYSTLGTASLVGVIGATKAVIKVANSAAIETTSNTAVGIASRISRTAGSRVKAVAKKKVEAVSTAHWGVSCWGKAGSIITIAVGCPNRPSQA